MIKRMYSQELLDFILPVQREDITISMGNGIKVLEEDSTLQKEESGAKELYTEATGHRQENG